MSQIHQIWTMKAETASVIQRTQTETAISSEKRIDEQDVDPDAFWARVKTNLQAGKIRLLFVADVEGESESVHGLLTG